MHDRNGFTLVELLVVMVILGVLAAIALPKFTGTKEKAYVASMEADLRNLASQQEIFSSDNARYSDDASELRFGATSGVEVEITTDDSGLGWWAVANHTGTNRTCAIFYGDVAAVAPAEREGVVACEA